MQLSAVVLARVIAFIETFDLSPRGRVFYPDVVREIIERYQLSKISPAVPGF